MTGEGESEGVLVATAEINEGELISESAGGEMAEVEKKPPKLKKKQMQAILEMDMKFKKVGFEQALTAEEKAAKKAARLAQKKKKKEKKESAGEVAAEKKQEATEERKAKKDEGTKEESEQKEEVVKKDERDEETGKKKTKKGKKAKSKQDEEVPEEKKTDERKKKEKKAKKVKAEAEVVVDQEKPTESGEKPEEEKKPKGKKGKKKYDTESAPEEEDKVKKKKKGKRTPKISESLTTEEEGAVSKKAKKRKKKQKKEEDAVPSDTIVSQPPTEDEVLDEAETTERKKKSYKKEKQVRLPTEKKKTSKALIKGKGSFIESQRAIVSSASMSASGTPGSFLDTEVSSSSSEDTVTKKGEKKRKQTGKKQEKPADLEREVKAEGKKEGKAEEEEQKKEEKVKDEEQKKDEERKGKKKKKKKTGDEIESTVEENDIMAEIRRMEAQAETQVLTSGEAIEEQPELPPKKKKKGKQGPKKKLSKKQRTLLAQEQAEKARIQAELEAQRLIEEEKKRIQEERKMAKERDKRETAEQALRNEQLAFSSGLIKAMLDQNWKISDKEKKDSEWTQYLKCDGLPNPINPPQMNTYLHLWEQIINDVSVEEVVRRTNEVLQLVETLQDYIDDPFNVTESLVEDWKWVRKLCRDHLKETLDMATYRLLRDIDSRLNRIDIPTADFNIIDKDFSLCLYVLVQQPTPMYNPRNVTKKKLEINFPNIKMKAVYPLSIETKFMATRAMYLRFDHLSDTCATYDPIVIPTQYETNLLEVTSQEWYKQLLYKYENRKRPEKKTVEDEFGNLVEIEPPPEPELIEGELPPTVPFQILDPPASQYVVELEDKIYADNRADDRLQTVVGENVVNLRKYMFIGGVYFLELFYQPPQPKDMVAFEVRLTALKLPKRLEEVPIYIHYVPPPPEDPLVQKTPEELEQDVKKQEAVLDSLISITVTLPEHVMFLDLPIVCQWDDERKVWTTQDVIDLKHIEEQNYITFRTGLFGPFALGVNRYLNFPFQMWEIKPEIDGTVTFQLTCAILMIEFNIKGNTICMTQLQNSPNNALQDVIGIYFKLSKLIRILRDGGVDIFPAYDAFNYIEGVCEKQWPMEKHTYYSMGLLSCIFNFSYSRWNNQAGRRKLVMQMREYHPEKTKQKTHNMLLVTPLNATYIDCTEISPAFNETPNQHMKFCSDLFHLMKATCSISTRNKILNGPQDVAKALADVLIATRILSFS